MSPGCRAVCVPVSTSRRKSAECVDSSAPLRPGVGAETAAEAAPWAPALSDVPGGEGLGEISAVLWSC